MNVRQILDPPNGALIVLVKDSRAFLLGFVDVYYRQIVLTTLSII